ncbi:hypothetical protein [Enterococcus sp. AZ192]|uniref:hypothetical protein n=1 Tax=unclassified Enterococcus TaxID=2608891 RepID=UPI003D277C09
MKNKKITLSIIGLILVGGISVGAIHQQNVKAERVKQEEKNELKNTVQENQEDPYKNLSKAKAENVAKLDKTVSKIITEKLNTKPLDGLKDTEEALKTLDVKDADLKSIHDSYAGVVNVVKTPTIDTLQKARSAMANMEEADISDHMLDEYEDKLIEIVSREKSINKADVDKQSKPLTPQQLKAKEDAKAKADKEAADKAKAEADKKVADEAKAAADKAEAARVAEAERQAATQDGAEQSQAINNGGGGNYTPPVADNSGGGDYTPPANNGGGASSNDAAQDAASNTPTPAPPSKDLDTTGTNDINGNELEPGGW